MARLVLILMALLLLVGCSQMQDAADRSARNSKRAADNSDALIKLSSSAYADGRQGAGRDRRMQEIQRLESATDLNSKIVSASAYLAAFEFQLWKDFEVPGDSRERREGLAAEAVMEFLRQMKAYITPGEITVGLNPTAALSEAQKNLLAFAISLHRVSERQREASIAGRFKTMSMFDLLAAGIGATGKSSDPTSRATVEVQKDLDTAVAVIQTRRIGLFAAAVAKLRNPAEMQAVLSGQAEAVWTIKIDEIRSVDQLEAVTELLKGSIQSAKVLAGYPHRLPPVEPIAKLLMAKIRGGGASSNEINSSGQANPLDTKKRELDQVVSLLPEQAASLNP